MSLNKARKRLIRKYRKMYNSRPIGFRSFEITINQAISKEELNGLKGVLW